MDKHDVLRSLTSRAYARRFEKDACIFLEGSLPEEGLAFVLSGSVRICREAAGNAVLLGRVQSGQFFGETALVLRRKRSASAWADEANTVVLFLNTQEFLKEAAQNYHLIRLLTQETLDRLGLVNQTLFRQKEIRPFIIDPGLRQVLESNRDLNKGIPDLVNNTRSVCITPAQPMIRQGEKNSGQAFLVTEGELVVSRLHEGKEVDLQTFQAGDIIPPLPVHLCTQRDWSVLSRTGTSRALALDEEVLFRIMGLNQRMFFHVFQSFLIQLMILDDSLEMTIKNTGIPAV